MVTPQRRTQEKTAPETTISDNAKHALSDMVEFEMYITAQPQETPWPMAPRTIKTAPEGKAPCSDSVESGTAKELLALGFIERSSTATYVVSKSGYAFYEREIKTHL